MIFWPGFAVRSGITHPSGHIDAPQDRAEAEAPDDPPDDPDVHFSADTQARWIRNGAKRTPGYKMVSNGFAHPEEARTRKVSLTKVHTGHLRTGPGARARYHDRSGEHAGRYWPTRPVPTRPPARSLQLRDHANGARHQHLRALEKRFSRLISKRRLRDCALLWHDEAPLDSFGLAKTRRPTGNVGNRAAPAPQTPTIA